MIITNETAPGRYDCGIFTPWDELIKQKIVFVKNSGNDTAITGGRNFLGGILVVPDGVTTIKAEAFHSCTRLREVVLPDSVTKIENGAFECCYNLENVRLSQNLEKLGLFAFFYCTSLRSIYIPGGVSVIETSTFYDCKHLASVELSEGLKTIKGDAFVNNESLVTIHLPKSLTTIESYAFSHSNLTTVVLKNGDCRVEAGAFDMCPLELLVTERGTPDILNLKTSSVCDILSADRFIEGRCGRTFPSAEAMVDFIITNGAKGLSDITNEIFHLEINSKEEFDKMYKESQLLLLCLQSRGFLDGLTLSEKKEESDTFGIKHVTRSMSLSDNFRELPTTACEYPLFEPDVAENDTHEDVGDDGSR